MTTEFQAYGTAGKAYGDTPRAAAMRYFADNPKSRKCNVTEGTRDGAFFTVRYGRSSAGEWPYSARDVTKRMAAQLPDTHPKKES